MGPRLSFTTAWSANAASICASCGLGKVARIEPSRRLLFHAQQPLSPGQQDALAAEARLAEPICRPAAPLSEGGNWHKFLARLLPGTGLGQG